MLSLLLASVSAGAFVGGGIILAIVIGMIVVRVKTGKWPTMNGGI